MNPVTTTGGRQHHAVPLGTMCVFELPWDEQVDRGRPVGREGGRGLLNWSVDSRNHGIVTAMYFWIGVLCEILASCHYGRIQVQTCPNLFKYDQICKIIVGHVRHGPIPYGPVWFHNITL